MKAAALQEAMKYLGKFALSLAVGAIGGWMFGFIILSFCYFIGRSGDSPNEGLGYWNPHANFGLAGFYGMPLGLVMFPIGYFAFLQKVSLTKALMFCSGGILIGGLAGSLLYAPGAAFFGVIGFFLASAFISARS